MNKSNDIENYYINKETGRLVKSSSKSAKELMKSGKLQKHKCLFNIKSAKVCLNQLLSRYPGIVHPPSSFTKIPKTYTRGEWRAFIIDSEFNKDANANTNANFVKIIGTINSWGELRRLNQELVIKSKNIIIVRDPTKHLERVIKENNVEIKSIDNKFIVKQLQTAVPVLDDIDSINLIYNPVHNDFIPILRQNMDITQQIELLNFLNNMLITQILPSENNTIAGVVIFEKELSGVVTKDNKLIKITKDNKLLAQENLSISNFLRLKISQEKFLESAKFPPLKRYNKIINGLQQPPKQNMNEQFELIWDPLWKRSKVLIVGHRPHTAVTDTQRVANEQHKSSLFKMEDEIDDKMTDEIVSLESIDVGLKDDVASEIQENKNKALSLESIEVGLKDMDLKEQFQPKNNNLSSLIVDKKDNILGYI